MRVLCIAAVMALLASGPAYAQQDGHVQRYGEKDKEKTREQIQAEKDAERAYKRSLRNIPDKGPVDPWGSVRASDGPKTDSPKTAAPQKTTLAKSKSKTGEPK